MLGSENSIEDRQSDITEHSSQYNLSFLLDEQYQMTDIKNVYQKRQDKADKIIGRIMSLISDAEIGDACHDAQAKETKYVVQFSKDIKEELDSGKVKLVANKSGELFAQVRESNGHYGVKLPIKPETVARGLDPQAIATYMQMKAIQKQLDDVFVALGEIGSKVSEVARGQHNDRLALYYSGLNMYYEAGHIKNEALRIGLMAQALQSLNEANSQVMKELKDNIDYIVHKSYFSIKDKKKRLNDIDEKMNTINQCFDVIHRAAVIKAMIYYETGELDAMLAVIEEYGKFIDNMIVPNEGILREHDKSDIYLQGGIWESRVKTLSSMNELRDAVTDEDVFYLDTKENKDEAR